MTIYEKRFNRNSPYWTTLKSVNENFIECMKKHFDGVLQLRGYVFLKDIYEYLGLPITRDSIIVGWIYDPKKYIGIEYENTSGSDFMLKFKTDGIILTHFN